MSTEARDPITRFYERHPYPPPPEDLAGESIGWEDGARRRLEHARLWPGLPFRGDHTILVAGCGTYQAVRYGIRYPEATVLGIDVSRAGVESNERLARHHGVDNVHAVVMPIEEVADLGRTFDHVVCTGVVHHLVDPVAGLIALRDVMAPTAAMHLMVYGTHGRTGVTMIRDYCRLLGLTASPTEIDDLVATLRELPEGHPVAEVLRTSPDFRDDDALADALLNPRERHEDVPGVFRMLDSAGLRFSRWFRQAPYQPTCGAIAETPHAARVAALPERERYAAMELFRGTMVRHSLIAHRDDAPASISEVTWDEPHWRRLVPHRPDSVVVVQERLPPGTAGVLINRAHRDRDLVYFADAATLAAFELVDGSTPLGDIDGATATMFRHLWEHDLVIIGVADAHL